MDIPYYDKLKFIYHDPFSYHKNNDEIQFSINESINFLNYENEENLNPNSSIELEYEQNVQIFIEYFDEKPDSIVRVPYVIELLGDSVTNIFSKKVMTTLTDDIKVFYNKRNDALVKIEFFDFPKNNFEININDLFSNNISHEKYNQYSHIYYVLNGLMHSLSKCNLLDSEVSNLKGLNMLFNLGPYFIQKQQSYINSYISSFITGFTLYQSDFINNFSKSTLFNMIYSSLNSLNISDRDEFSLLDHVRKGFYAHLSAIFYLNLNEIGIFQNNKTSIKTRIDKLSTLNFETFTTEPPIFYKAMNHSNKRKLEIYFAIAVILTGMKKDKLSFVDSIEDKEMINLITNIDDFFLLFDNDISILNFHIDKYLSKDFYTKERLENELNKSLLNKILNQVEYGESIILNKNPFDLKNKITFIKNEYFRIDKVISIFESELDIANKLLKEISLSNNELNTLYNTWSDEVKNNIDNIKQLNKEICIRNTSYGWGGQISIFAERKELFLFESIFLKRLDQITSSSENIKLWITNNFSEYVRLNFIGGSFAILNPKYEDFMINIKKLDEINLKTDN